MDFNKIRQKVRCGACRGKLGRHLNLVELRRKATWEHPTSGNLLTGEWGMACAILCDVCMEANLKAAQLGVPGVEIVEAVECRGEDAVYHDVRTLEKVQ